MHDGTDHEMSAVRLQAVDEAGAKVASADLLFFVDVSALAEVHYKEIFGPLGADEIDVSLLLVLAGLKDSPEASRQEPIHSGDPGASSHLYASSAIQFIFDDMDAPDTGSLF